MADHLATAAATYRVLADDGTQRWSFRFEAADRAATARAIDAAVAGDGLHRDAAAAMRRHVAWTALPDVIIEPKPVRIAGTTVTILRDAL